MDNPGVGQKAIYAYSTVLSKEFPFVEKLNSMACQASAERAWSSISRFYENCKRGVKGKKGYPRFQKDCCSVEYKTSGWRLSDDRKRIDFIDNTKSDLEKL
jgi:putative transposase